MNTVRIIVAFLTTFVFSQVASAETLTVAANSGSGTYSKTLGEIIGVCNDENLTIVEAKDVTGGAVGNLDALFNNKADAAFLHSDVFFYNSQADSSYNALKTLVSLWPEQIHTIALQQSKTPMPGTWNSIRKNMKDFNDLSDFGDYKIGAIGGSAITAKILQGQGRGGFTVVDTYANGKELMSALDNGEIAGVILVGAAPLPNLETPEAKAKYKILPIGEAISKNVEAVYRPATVNYVGMTNGPVKTLAPIATLLTRKFSATGKKVAAQRQFRACFKAKLGDLQDTASRYWQQVDPADEGVLKNYYEIPGEDAKK